MGALAQSHFGPAQGKAISAYITVSTGVGGARIVDGKIDRNTFGFEPGWQIIDAGNMLCNGWSEKGYLIDYVGGMGIAKNKGSKAEEIYDEAFWRSRAEFLAYGLYNIALMWSPEVISIGGSIASRIPFNEIEKYYYEHIKKVFPQEHPIIVPAQYGDEMGLWGSLGYIKMYKV
jgi:predicted NBD/HSP70 family sugar kinase